MPTSSRDKVSNYFIVRSNVIKKAQRKDIQHDNPGMFHGKINAKNTQKVIAINCKKEKCYVFHVMASTEWR